MKRFITGLLCGLLFSACAAGSKSLQIDFDMFPKRVDEESIWVQCDNKKEGEVCKEVCNAYNRKNKCRQKEEKEERRYTSALIGKGYVVISRKLLLDLLRRSM